MDTELRKLQLIDTEILTDVVTVLNKHKLKYYMIAGTLLGAVRHNGFIPWDDDMDIAMPRKDYDKFLELYSSELPEHIHVKNFMNTIKFKYYITRVVDDRYYVKEIRNQDRQNTTNVSIDIFPLDGVPDNRLFRTIFYIKVLTYRALISLAQSNNIDFARKRNFLETAIIHFGIKLPLNKIVSPQKMQYRIDRLLKKQNDNSFLVGSIMGAYRIKEIFPRKYLGNGKYYSFEGAQFIGPESYDAYLTHMYGNYMELPTKEQQKSKRHFIMVRQPENKNEK
ncbi:LicD family protein [Lactiplantibacillus plantarum]|uniref:LicD family protein n=1 Tax=Lactiplantibacillus plantarum TaxID=1590 RepID=UPI0039C22B68